MLVHSLAHLRAREFPCAVSRENYGLHSHTSNKSARPVKNDILHMPRFRAEGVRLALSSMISRRILRSDGKLFGSLSSETPATTHQSPVRAHGAAVACTRVASLVNWARSYRFTPCTAWCSSDTLQRYFTFTCDDVFVMRRQAVCALHSGDRFIITVLCSQHIGQVVPKLWLFRMVEQGLMKNSLREAEIATPVFEITQSERCGILAGPARNGTAVGAARFGQHAHRLEVVGGPQITEGRGGLRDLVWRDNQHAPVTGSRPGALEHRQRTYPAAGGGRAQSDGSLPEVVADDHGVMPLRQPAQTEILHHKHRTAGCYFGDEIAELRRIKRVDQTPALACRRGEFNLQAAAALWQIDLRFQLLGGDLHPLIDEQSGECGRAALQALLGIEGHRVKLGLRRDLRGRVAQVEGLPGCGTPGEQHGKCRRDQDDAGMPVAVHLVCRISARDGQTGRYRSHR